MQIRLVDVYRGGKIDQADVDFVLTVLAKADGTLDRLRKLDRARSKASAINKPADRRAAERHVRKLTNKYRRGR